MKCKNCEGQCMCYYVENKSCSLNSLLKEKVIASKDKDPETLRYTNQSGSDIPLSDKVREYGAYEGKDVAEAVRKLKEEIGEKECGDGNCNSCKIDKIFGVLE